MKHCIADVEMDVGMKKLKSEETWNRRPSDESTL